MFLSLDILGIKVNCLTFTETIHTIESWLNEKTSSSRYLVTPNPEIIVYSQKDKDFAKILNCADLSIPDGSGLIWASKILSSRNPSPSCHPEPRFGGVKDLAKRSSCKEKSSKIPERVTGTDLMLKLCSLALKKGWTIGLLGGGENVAQKTAEVLRHQFPGINIVFAESGGNVDKKGNMLTKNSFDILHFTFDIVFVAFGFPKQEYWIAKNINKFPAKIFIPVGGAFDFIAGNVKRAPKWLQNLHLEWLFRLIQQPSRLPRHLTASKFFWLVLTAHNSVNSSGSHPLG